MVIIGYHGIGKSTLVERLMHGNVEDNVYSNNESEGISK